MDMQIEQQNSRLRSTDNNKINIPIPENVLRRLLELSSDNASRPSHEWMDFASCSTLEPSVMYPVDDLGIQTAKECCEVCPVRAECLANSIINKENYGIWGGLTPSERNKLTRKLPTLRIIK